MTRWLVAALLGAVVLAACSSGHKPNALILPKPVSSANISPGGQKLLDVLQAGGTVTFHAKYAVSGPATKSGGLQSLEIWQRGNQRREDTVLEASGHMDHTASFTRAGSVQTCIQVDTNPWSCQKSAVDPNNLLATVAGAVAGNPVTQSTATVDGQTATCFQVGTPQQGVELCATSKGIPVRISTATATYDLASLDSNVDTSVFTVPSK